MPLLTRGSEGMLETLSAIGSAHACLVGGGRLAAPARVRRHRHRLGQGPGEAIIDDQDISRYLLKQLFANAQITVLEASNGRDGLRAAGIEQPDLVILDLVMPEVDGFEVLYQLRANPATQSIPVIVATSKTLSHEERQQLVGQVMAIFPKEKLNDNSAPAELRTMLASAGLGDIFGPNSETAAVSRPI